jgi:hypothetical protein
MQKIVILLGALGALTLLRKLMPFLVMRLFGRAIGSRAVSRQPDAIHLEKCDPTSWKDRGAILPLVSPLLQRGFQDAGVFRVNELPGLTLQLLVEPHESMMGVVYEHPKAGHWVEVAARYRDGESITCSSSPPTGLAPRPGHAVINAPELGAAALYERARADSGSRPRERVTTFSVQTMFERAYAESIAYRKQKGVSAREVANVAAQKRKAA